jgi:hypothetical protein
MPTRIQKSSLLLVLLACWGVAGIAGAVELTFTPADQHVDLGDQGSLSIWLDEALEIRTIEVTVQYDGAVLTDLGGGPGAAFQDLPCYVWEEYIPGAGEWYGFCVAVGADCFVVGPGELFIWDFIGSNPGTAAVTAASIVLYDRYGELVESVTLAGTTVVVVDPATAVGDLPSLGEPVILASPNPCNPLTSIKFWLPTARHATLAVYDVEGRRIRTLLDGPVSDAWTTIPWDGRTDAGRAVASGVYLYRLDAGRDHLAGRVTVTRGAGG